MKIVFAGTPEFAAKHLAGLIELEIPIHTVITQPDKPGKRGKNLIASPVKQLAERHQIPVRQPEKFTADDLTDIEPDLMIVVAYGQILRQTLLDTPKFGCINVHASLLPRWRGAAPIQRAIEHGDPETGICIMQMDAGLDTGPVLYSAKLNIEAEDTSATLADKLVPLGLAGLQSVIAGLADESTQAVPQTEQGATYAKKLLKHEARIEWQNSAEDIKNKIHGFNPDPVCFTEMMHEGKALRVKLYQVCKIDPDRRGTPGEILNVSTEGVEVATATGSVTLELVQLPLGKGSVLSGRDILNARSDILHPGVQFS